jgi:error-prone DNA polymerase
VSRPWPPQPAYAELVAAHEFLLPARRLATPATSCSPPSLLGHSGIGIADRNTVAGVVRAHAPEGDARPTASFPRQGEGGRQPRRAFVWVDMPQAFADRPFTPEAFRHRRSASGSPRQPLVFADGTPDIVVYPANRSGWGRLCRLLTDRQPARRQGRMHPHSRRSRRRHPRSPADPDAGRDSPVCLRCLPGSDEAAPGRSGSAPAMGRRGEDRRRLFAPEGDRLGAARTCR